MNSYIVGFYSVKMNFQEMQAAFQAITDSEDKSLKPIQIGLKRIKEVSNFLKKASNCPKINYITNQEDINTTIQKLITCFSDVIFIATKGKISILSENFKPEKKTDIDSAKTNLKRNQIAALALENLIEKVINPASKALDEVKKTIEDNLKKTVELDDVEIKLLSSSFQEPSLFEIHEHTVYMSGVGQPANNSLLNELKIKPAIQKPKDMERSDFNNLKDLLSEIPKHKKMLTTLKSALDAYPGLGLKVVK